MGRTVLRTVLLAALVYLAGCTMMFLRQDSLIFPREFAGTPRQNVPHGGEVLRATSDDGVPIHAWFLPGQGRSPASPGPLAVLAHGNGELIEDMLPVARTYQELGVSVLLPEYRGYGDAPGTPSERAIVADFERLTDLAAARPEVDPSRLVYHGRSLGGGVVGALASRKPPAAMMLVNTFRSVRAMAWAMGVPGFLVRHPFNTERVLRSLNCPVLIFHGSADEIIPVSHGRRLAQTARQGTYIETDRSHNEDPLDPAEFRQQLRQFLESAGVLEPVQPR